MIRKNKYCIKDIKKTLICLSQGNFNLKYYLRKYTYLVYYKTPTSLKMQV